MSWTIIKSENLKQYFNSYHNLKEDAENYILLLSDKYAFLPKYFIKNYPSELLYNYNGKIKYDYIKIDYNFTKKLRDNQLKAMDTLKKYYENYNNINGILKFPTGFGKTVISLYLSSFLKYKTMIIVDREPLMKQWIESILNFTDLTENDIGIIQAKLINLNKPIVICMAQTLVSYFKKKFEFIFTEIQKAGFGTLFYDEVHSTGSANTYSKLSILFNPNNIIGLSATPYLYGPQKILLQNTIGNIIYESKDYEMIPKYYFVQYNSGITNIKYTTKKGKTITIGNWLKFISDFIYKRSIYNKYILEAKNYLHIIKIYVEKLLESEHKIFIICSVKSQVETISNNLEKYGIKTRKYYGDEKEKIESSNDNVIIGTYSYAGKGFDYPGLSALIYASPYSGKISVFQSVGRILRSCEGKKEPVVIDLIDMDVPTIFNEDVKKKKTMLQNEYSNIKILNHFYDSNLNQA
jgi:superfamily II DNA or RNA helicase